MQKFLKELYGEEFYNKEYKKIFPDMFISDQYIYIEAQLDNICNKECGDVYKEYLYNKYYIKFIYEVFVENTLIEDVFIFITSYISVRINYIKGTKEMKYMLYFQTNMYIFI